MVIDIAHPPPAELPARVRELRAVAKAGQYAFDFGPADLADDAAAFLFALSHALERAHAEFRDRAGTALRQVTELLQLAVDVARRRAALIAGDDVDLPACLRVVVSTLDSLEV